jgi:predicted small lipoprotein YifL
VPYRSRLSLVLLAALSVSLAACGRRGPPEPPPMALAPTEDPLAASEDERDPSFADQMPAPSIFSSGPAQSPNKRSRIIKAPKKPFILDPIL